MACICAREAAYCLSCAEIPGNILKKIECNKCRNSGAGYVSFALLSDSAVSMCYGFTEWATSYLGTTVQNVKSIVEHGEVLMPEDILCNGIQMRKKGGDEQRPNAIVTSPDIHSAALTAEAETGGGDRIEFKVVLRLRQKPGTYEIVSEDGDGKTMWSSNRRGTVYIDALEVFVLKSDRCAEPQPIIPAERRRFVGMYDCTVQQEMFNLLQTLNLSRSFFDSKHNMCYCSSCYSPSWPKSELAAGETYSVPNDWVRFGLAVNPVVERIHDIWQSWPTAFHGCHPDRLASVISSRGLLIPGDVLPDGSIVRENAKNKRKPGYYLSPEINYAAHPLYARPRRMKAAEGTVCFQTVLVFKVRPHSYEKQEDSEVAGMKLYEDYSVVRKKEMELVSARRGSTHPFGILVRKLYIGSADELKQRFPLPAHCDVDNIFC